MSNYTFDMIVSSDNDFFVETVNEYIQSGWKRVDKPIIRDGDFIQVMEREPPKAGDHRKPDCIRIDRQTEVCFEAYFNFDPYSQAPTGKGDTEEEAILNLYVKVMKDPRWCLHNGMELTHIDTFGCSAAVKQVQERLEGYILGLLQERLQ